MKDVLKVISIIMQLLPYIKEIIEFLTGLQQIKKVAGDDVAKQIATDSAVIAQNWKQYLQQSRTSTYQDLNSINSQSKD